MSTSRSRTPLCASTLSFSPTPCTSTATRSARRRSTRTRPARSPTRVGRRSPRRTPSGSRSLVRQVPIDSEFTVREDVAWRLSGAITVRMVQHTHFDPSACGRNERMNTTKTSTDSPPIPWHGIGSGNYGRWPGVPGTGGRPRSARPSCRSIATIPARMWPAPRRSRPSWITAPSMESPASPAPFWGRAATACAANRMTRSRRFFIRSHGRGNVVSTPTWN